ncbi:MAG: hypothetical protein ACREBV_08875, partial [Candidatus Zixiibacteriota bacterium]
MKSGTDSKHLLEEFAQFQPDFDGVSRALAIYSAAIAIADEAFIKEASQKAVGLGAGLTSVFEMMLQSYLFLGFPRMLT